MHSGVQFIMLNLPVNVTKSSPLKYSSDTDFFVDLFVDPRHYNITYEGWIYSITLFSLLTKQTKYELIMCKPASNIVSDFYTFCIYVMGFYWLNSKPLAVTLIHCTHSFAHFMIKYELKCKSHPYHVSCQEISHCAKLTIIAK